CRKRREGAGRLHGESLAQARPCPQTRRRGRRAGGRYLPRTYGGRRGAGPPGHTRRGRWFDVIASVRGTLVEASAARVVVEVGGVGYLLFSPDSTLRALPAMGEEVHLHVHTHVREDAIQLFGFASQAEMRLFETVVGVGGIGPR